MTERLSPCCGVPIDRAPHCPRCGEPQGPLPLRAPHSNETTSKEAAESLKVDQLGKLEFRVWYFVAKQREYGATDQEIERGTGLGGNTVRPRRRTLIMLGLLKASGKVRTTHSGRKAIVWTTS